MGLFRKKKVEEPKSLPLDTIVLVYHPRQMSLRKIAGSLQTPEIVGLPIYPTISPDGRIGLTLESAIVSLDPVIGEEAWKLRETPYVNNKTNQSCVEDSESTRSQFDQVIQSSTKA